MTVISTTYRPIVNYDPETGGEFYCKKNIFDTMFVQTIVMWSSIGTFFLIIFILTIYGSIELKKTKEGNETTEENVVIT